MFVFLLLSFCWEVCRTLGKHIFSFSLNVFSGDQFCSVEGEVRGVGIRVGGAKQVHYCHLLIKTGHIELLTGALTKNLLSSPKHKELMLESTNPWTAAPPGQRGVTNRMHRLNHASSLVLMKSGTSRLSHAFRTISFFRSKCCVVSCPCVCDNKDIPNAARTDRRCIKVALISSLVNLFA